MHCPEIGCYGDRRRLGNDTHERRLGLVDEMVVGELDDYEGA